MYITRLEKCQLYSCMVGPRSNSPPPLFLTASCPSPPLARRPRSGEYDGSGLVQLPDSAFSVMIAREWTAAWHAIDSCTNNSSSSGSSHQLRNRTITWSVSDFTMLSRPGEARGSPSGYCGSGSGHKAIVNVGQNDECHLLLYISEPSC